MSLLITHAGIAAAIRAGDLGIEYKITHISIGSAGYVPNPDQTALVAEIQRKAITRGALVAQGQLHFETVWDGDEEFEGKELGYWLEDGTLFAVDSRDGEVITYKHKNTVVTEACELNLSASTIENITVEFLGSPYATEQVSGTAKIATSALVIAGVDDATIVTPNKLNKKMAAHKEEDNPHVQYPLAGMTQGLPYNHTRIYSLGEVCYTKDEATGKVSYWEWYSNTESLAGKDPLDQANRRPGWSDTTKPFYWKPFSSKIPGETMAWDSELVPEHMIVAMGQQLPVTVYHSLAAVKPEWIDDTNPLVLNIPDRRGLFTRAADGSHWLAGQSHDDAIRNITGSFNASGSTGSASSTKTQGAIALSNTSSWTNYVNGQSGAGYNLLFDASNVVPTSEENQPKGYIEWMGYAL